jgi:diaminopimelate decarboxylase
MPSFDVHDSLDTILSRATPILPDETLRAFVKTYFDQRDRYLRILDDHSAPIYLLDTSTLHTKAGQLKTAFEKKLGSVGFYFAVKSNNHPATVKTMLAARFGLDVSSGLELEMALSLGAGDIVFSGPGKTVQELDLAATYSDRVVVLIDSFGELQRLQEIAAGLNRTVRCGVRLTVNAQGLWRKFGIGVEQLPSFWQAATQYPHLNFMGLQFHTSWNMSPRPQVDFIKILGESLKRMPGAFKRALRFIDIGGGYWPGQGEWLHPRAAPRGRLLETLGAPEDAPQTHHCIASMPIEAFAGQLAEAIKDHLLSTVACRICLEPGRWICNDAMHLLLSVVDKKAPDLVITDAGTNAIGWERFESDYFPVLNLTRPGLLEKPCHILGSLCTPHDVWGYMYFGETIEPGDILMIPTQGAYTYSLRQNFIKPIPEVVVI